MTQNAADKKIGIIGLGNMGNGMAQTLIREGFSVVGTDLGESQRTAAAAMGVEVVDSIQSLCAQCENIILSLPMAKHVQAVINGPEGLLKHATKNTLIVDTTTSEPNVTRELATTLSKQGHHLLDCPVSGGPAGASAGTMVIVAGGEKKALERAMPFLNALSSKVVHLGESGSGHAAKLINNLLCAAHLITTAEAVALGKKAGLDPQALIEGLNAGSGGSAISQVNFPRWILNEGFDSGFSMKLMRKDVRLAQQLISDMGMNLSLSEKAAEIWAESENTIADEDDFNCIVKNHL
ncbi:3-hydroxyisobutyrate dehydrogenase [Psychromonas sp. MB-3u-54]|uniref:NAD(P)-dependent oxidoreductase n=1 Tax=Psychromonas sp. MB-3u-54 TaxID=2058319 RepID=UPI000C33B954|nr:NAD(P)-dependent oxidoreductase [Psychromonas sp. MB-3u-54]PKH03792.1 3-hydroxyisobutyrate dehydrogenase [Psychromonas sp. MB-3u-54]